jgi:hypothetical protein
MLNVAVSRAEDAFLVIGDMGFSARLADRSHPHFREIIEIMML